MWNCDIRSKFEPLMYSSPSEWGPKPNFLRSLSEAKGESRSFIAPVRRVWLEVPLGPLLHPFAAGLASVLPDHTDDAVEPSPFQSQRAE